MTSFLFGGAVGLVAGLLFAPRAGEETRALVADKVDEYWGKGQDFYTKGVTRVQTGVADIKPQVTQKGDELRDKIENARNLIADQVAKNAATAREVINDKIPIAAEKVSAAVDVARTQIDNAASVLLGRATELSEESTTVAGDASTADETAAEASATEAAESLPASAGTLGSGVTVDISPVDSALGEEKTTPFVDEPVEPASSGPEAAPAF
jgi:gas vesicle protein